MAEGNGNSNFSPDLISQEQCVYAVQNARKTHSLAPQRRGERVKCAQFWHQNLFLLQVLTLRTLRFLTARRESNTLAIDVPAIIVTYQMCIT
jgi:hypothetical protein